MSDCNCVIDDDGKVYTCKKCTKETIRKWRNICVGFVESLKKKKLVFTKKDIKLVKKKHTISKIRKSFGLVFQYKEIGGKKKMSEERAINKFSDAWKVYRTKHDWFYCRKKPVIIMAIQMDKDFNVFTLEGIHKGKAGDYLLQGVDKEVYPCKKEIFEKTYKKIKWFG